MCDGTKSAFGMPGTRIGDVADKLIDMTLERHAWLIRAGEQIRAMNEQESTRDGSEPKKPLPTDK